MDQPRVPAGSPEGGQFASKLGTFAGKSGAIGPVHVSAYRVGALEDTGRGVFFGDSPESISSYAENHPGQKVEEYEVEAKSAYVTKSQFSLFKEIFPGPKTFHDTLYDIENKIMKEQKKAGKFVSGDSILASRRVEEKMARELRKRGHDAVIYTDPPAPAKQEIALFKPRAAAIRKVMGGK